MTDDSRQGDAIAAQPTGLALSDEGLFVAKTQKEASDVAIAWIRSGLVPKAYRPNAYCSDLRRPLTDIEAVRRVVGAMQYLASLQVPVLTNLRYVAIINGTPMMHSDLPLALVMRSGLAQGPPDEMFFTCEHQPIGLEFKNLNEEVWGASCRVQRKGGPVVTRTFTLDDARRAKLYPDEHGRGVGPKWADQPWALYTRRMLQMRARSMALKDVFPDVLGGVTIAEYDSPQGFAPDDHPQRPAPANAKVIDVTRSPASDLDDAYPNTPETDV